MRQLSDIMDRQQSEVKVLPPMPAASPATSDQEVVGAAAIPLKRELSNFPMICQRRASSAEHVSNLAKELDEDSDVEMFSRTMDDDNRMKVTSKRMRTAVDKWVSTGRPQEQSSQEPPEEEMPLGNDGAQEALRAALQRSAPKLNLAFTLTIHENPENVGKKSSKKSEKKTENKTVEKPAAKQPVEPELPAGCRPFKAGVDDSGPRPYSDSESTHSGRSSSSSDSSTTQRPRFPRGAEFDNSFEGIKRHSQCWPQPSKMTSFIGAEYPVNKMNGAGKNNFTMLSNYCNRAGEQCKWPLSSVDPLVALKADVPPEHLMQNIANMLVWSTHEENHSWYRQQMQKDDRYCPFYSQSIPGITPAMYLQRLRLHFGSTAGCFIAACIYIDRLGMKCVNEHTIHRMFLTALVLGTKFCECDLYYENKYYGRCGGVIQNEMNMLEQTLIELLGWNLHISDREFAAYAAALYGPLPDRYWRGEY
jgi:hypothetical protein